MPRYARSFVVALIAAMAFLSCFVPAFYEPDEGRYAEIGREMLLHGDFLVPRYEGAERMTKPPFTYWTSAIGIGLFGTHPFGARFFGALAGFATVLIAGGIARELASPRVAVATMVVLGTSLYGFVGQHFLSTDVFLTFWQALAALLALKALRDPSPARARWFSRGSWLALGGAFLTKGPPGLFVLTGILALTFARHRDRRRVILDPVALVGFVVVALSWYLATVLRDPERLRYFLVDEVWNRVATKVHDRNHSPLLYLGILTLGLTPWIRPLVDLLRDVTGWARSGRPRLSDAAFFAAWWIIPSLIVFTLSRSRMILYLQPILVPFAFAIARAADAALERRRPEAPPAGAWARGLLVFWCAVLLVAQWQGRELGRGGPYASAAAAIRADGAGSDFQILNATGNRVGSISLLADAPRPTIALARKSLLKGKEPVSVQMESPVARHRTYLIFKSEEIPASAAGRTIYSGRRLTVLRHDEGERFEKDEETPR